MNTSMIYQGEHMGIYLGKDVYIPIASLGLLDILGVLILTPITAKVLYPLLAKCDIHPSQLQRIGVGMLITTASMLCAGGLELSRVDHCCIWQKRGDNHTQVADISIFYQIPQYTLVGLSEVFTSITGTYIVPLFRLIVISSCSNTESVSDDLYWTSRKIV